LTDRRRTRQRRCGMSKKKNKKKDKKKGKK